MENKRNVHMMKKRKRVKIAIALSILLITLMVFSSLNSNSLFRNEVMGGMVFVEDLLTDSDFHAYNMTQLIALLGENAEQIWWDVHGSRWKFGNLTNSKSRQF